MITLYQPGVFNGVQVLCKVEPAPVTLVIPIFPYPPTGDSRLRISDLDLLLYWWVVVELWERVVCYLEDQQYSPRCSRDLWDDLIVAKRCVELAARDCPAPWRVSFAEHFGAQPEPLIALFVAREELWAAGRVDDLYAVLHGQEPKSNLIDFPVSLTRATERAADLNSQPPSSGKKAA